MKNNASDKFENVLAAGLAHVRKVIQFSAEGRIAWKADQLPVPDDDPDKAAKVKAATRPFVGTGEGYCVMVLQANVTMTDDPNEKPRVIHDGMLTASTAPHAVRLSAEHASTLWHQAAAKCN